VTSWAFQGQRFYLVIPYLRGFEGFDLTNPRGRFGGERFHLACPKLGLEDAILPHTILLQIYSIVEEFYISHRYKRREGAPLGVSSKGGAPFIEGRFDLAKEKGFGDLSIWVLLVGSSPSFLVPFERVIWYR
jgi:hypothetical protein